MSLIKRYIDIDFGVDARPLKRVPGTIVQGNNKVNVLRITYPNISRDHVVVALTQRADQVTGSTFLDYSANSGSFELVLHNWFTAVSGELQITFAIYSQTPEINEEGIITTETDTLRKVYLNVEESISADLPAPEDESIFLDIAVMVKSYDDRITALEPQFITDLSALDNFTYPGIYKFNLNNTNTFHLYVSEYTSNGVKYIRQIRSSATGYYARTNIDSVWNEWEDKKQYNINGITEWNESVNYKKGAIVSYFDNLFVCREENKNIIPYTDETYWNHITFDSYVVREDLNNYVLKEEVKDVDVDLSNYYDIPTANALLAAKEDKANLKALAYKNSLNKTDVGLSNVRNVESYSKTETDEKITDVIEIAEGKTKTFVVSTESNIKFKSNTDLVNLDISANPIVDISGKTINIDDIKVGDIFYVLEKEVADRWVSSITGNIIQLPKIETSKVNLTDYPTKTEMNTAIETAIGNALEADY